MSKSVAELMASPSTGLPTRTYEACLAQKLVAKVEALESEKHDIHLADLRVDAEAKPTGKPKRQGEGTNPRIAEIDAELVTLYDEMREHTGEFGLQGQWQGDWQNWRDAHPAREDGRDDRGRPIVLAIDDEVAYGYCNASDLVGRIGDFVVSWNGEPLQDGQWEWFSKRLSPGDLKGMAKKVVQMHELEGAKAVPLGRSASSTIPSSETASS